MDNFINFRVDGTNLFAQIDTDVPIEKPVIPFAWNCNSDIFANILKDYLYDTLHEYKKKIASDCLFYLDKKEISKLKSKLKKWDGSKHCWKG